jgi:hypothetical protein
MASQQSPPILMATPVQSLPKDSTTDAPPDPSVTDLLNEMENEVFQAKQAQAVHSAPPSMAQMPHIPQMPQMAPMGHSGFGFPMNYKEDGGLSKWIQIPHIKTAVVAMMIALLLFYPHGFFPAFYQRFSRATTLESYDLFIRIFLLGVFFYVVLVAVPY